MSDSSQHTEGFHKSMGMNRRPRRPRKKPTSVALDPELLSELKEIADSKGLPYQVLMRMFIIEGLKRLKALDHSRNTTE